MGAGAIFKILGEGAKAIVKNPANAIEIGDKLYGFADNIINKGKKQEQEIAVNKAFYEYFEKVQVLLEENENIKERVCNLEQENNLLKSENQKLKKNFLILATSCGIGIVIAVVLGILL